MMQTRRPLQDSTTLKANNIHKGAQTKATTTHKRTGSNHKESNKVKTRGCALIIIIVSLLEEVWISQDYCIAPNGDLGDDSITSNNPWSFCHRQLRRAIGNTNYNATVHSNLSLLATSLRKAPRGIRIGYATKAKCLFQSGETTRL
jgi:hypothetical protein